MVKGKLRCAVVEFSPVHDLTFPVLATATSRLGAQLDIYAPNRLIDQTAALPGNTHFVRIGHGRRPGTVLAVAMRLLRENYDVVWLNTAHGPRARLLLILLRLFAARRGIRLGIIHFTEKAYDAWSTKVILRLLHGAVVFSQFLRGTMPDLLKEKTFAWYPMIPTALPPLTMADGRIRIVVPGALDPGRRDYACIAKTLADPHLDPRIDFVLLGRCQRDIPAAQAWLGKLPAAALENGRVQLWDDYVADEVFQEGLNRAHGICLLMHPSCQEYRMFCDHQASGATYLAYNRGIPLLVEEGMLPAVTEFAPHIAAYAVNDFTAACNGVAQALDRKAAAAPAANLRGAIPLAADTRYQAAVFLRMVSSLANRRG